MKKSHEPVLTKEYLDRTYDEAEFTLATGLTNYDLRANEAAAFSNLKVYTTINIRTTQAISVRLNSTSRPAITVTANRPFELNNLLEITDIYISNSSGSTATIYVFGSRKGAIA